MQRMTDIKRKKSLMTDIAGKSWAEICDSSQSSQSQADTNSPLKNNQVNEKDEDDLYDLVFKSIKTENVKNATQEDLSLTSFMNNVHMVTPIKQESESSTTIIVDEDTIYSPFVKNEPYEDTLDRKLELPQIDSKEECFQRDILHAKRRLTSECGSMVSEPITPERNNKFNKKSTEHKNIHDFVESPKYVFFFCN